MSYIKRIKQVYKALTAKIEEADRFFLAKWLTKRESDLFWAMNLPDQRHCLNVAYTALALSEGGQDGIDKAKLMKCCLLHDVGKVCGDVSTFDKVMAVLIYGRMPALARRCRRRGRGGNAWRNFCHALYIYEYHPQIGYEKLMAIGEAEIAGIVARHHEARKSGDSAELLLLREADELN